MKIKFLYLTIILSLLLNVLFGIIYSYSYYKSNLESLTDNTDKPETKKDLDFYDGLDFKISGKYHNEKNFHRLPIKIKKIVSPKIWELSKNSSGIQIRFSTNSPVIVVKWIVSENSNKANMSKTGTSGIDLYCLVEGKWQYVNSGIPTSKKSESILISEMDSTLKEFIINLPLYDGIEKIEIGIKKGYLIKESSHKPQLEKPIVFYGTSITQGGSASRPGMAYTSIIGRNLEVEIINLGLSGNGYFEESLGNVLCEINAELFVIDCTPNSHPEIIKKNTLKLIKQIRKCRPNSPILLVESIVREYSYFKKSDSTDFGSGKFIKSQNQELEKSFNEAFKLGIKDLHYLKSENLIGLDHEGTVDGTHLSDLGHYRMANIVQNKIIEILKNK